MVKERPILFSSEMVRAILDGRKSMTRRVLKPQPKGIPFYNGTQGVDGCWLDHQYGEAGDDGMYCPYGKIGDQLYVREAYYQRGHWEPVPGVKTKTGRMKWKFAPADDVLLFNAPEEFRKGRHHKDPETVAWHKRLARFMPRKYSRIQLEITNIRAERLNDITEEDAVSEGVEPNCPMLKAGDIENCPSCHSKLHCEGEWIHYTRGQDDFPAFSAKESFQSLWESINDKGSWVKNEWVWVIEFRMIRE